MPDPIDVQDSVIQIYTPAVGATPESYATIQNVQGWNGTHGTEGGARTRVFGRAQPYVRAGEIVDTYSLSGLYDPADTGGQNVLRSARDNGTTIILVVKPNGTTGYRQECRVTEYTDSGDADGEYVEASFDLEAVGPRTNI